MSSQQVRPRHVASQLLACVIGSLVAASATAVDVTVTLHDDTGAAPPPAIVAFYPRHAVAVAPAPLEHRMDQVDKQFVPRLLAIHVGDRVNFPNSDNIRHHVYSFSPAHKFELPLYRGIPSAPVQFDTAGKVVLGCNIHDRMSAHIYVLDASLFALVEAGRHTFSAVAPGDYEVAVFHPRQQASVDGARHAVTIAAQATQSIELGVTLAPVVEPDDAGLSPLERKFKALRRGTP